MIDRRGRGEGRSAEDYKGDNETRITRANSPETACIFCMIRDVI